MIDPEELGRRLRALHAAMTQHGPHSQSVRVYDAAAQEVLEAESVDVTVEGSWGWWANKLLQGLET